jgi:hypothetical protein
MLDGQARSPARDARRARAATGGATSSNRQVGGSSPPPALALTCERATEPSCARSAGAMWLPRRPQRRADALGGLSRQLGYDVALGPASPQRGVSGTAAPAGHRPGKQRPWRRPPVGRSGVRSAGRRAVARRGPRVVHSYAAPCLERCLEDCPPSGRIDSRTLRCLAAQEEQVLVRVPVTRVEHPNLDLARS